MRDKAVRDLSFFSDSELSAEVARRLARKKSEEKEKNYCDECVFFVHWTDGGAMPQDYNPCSFGYAMKFQMPENFGDDWGFYRQNCPSRKSADEQSA